MASCAMPRLPTLPPDTVRCFARLDKFVVECPNCGQLLRAHLGGSVRDSGKQHELSTAVTEYSARRRQLRQRVKYRPGEDPEDVTAPPRPLSLWPKLPETFNPLTQRLKCPHCGRVWVVGLLLYPVRLHTAHKPPEDTRPTYRQLVALRAMAGGWVMAERKGGAEAVNVVVEGECGCEAGQPALEGCPVHGRQPEAAAPEATEATEAVEESGAGEVPPAPEDED